MDRISTMIIFQFNKPGKNNLPLFLCMFWIYQHTVLNESIAELFHLKIFCLVYLFR